VIGLALMPPGRFHPFDLDSFGLGTLLRAAEARGASQVLMGIGGSATNDGGFGLARSLGWDFLNGSGHAIDRWIKLDTMASLRPPKHPHLFRSLIVAVDVQNPLLGPHGCTRVYGPQKGLRKQDFPHAERCLGRLARVVQSTMGRDYALEPGAGGAGGLGFGLSSLLGAQLQPGFDVFARQAKLTRRLAAADLVITGEGALDRQTLMGKGVGQIGLLSRKHHIPCLGLAGKVLARGTQRCFTATRSLTDLTTLEEARTRPAYWLQQLAARAARDFAEP
jgi:glycerate 2-kinase